MMAPMRLGLRPQLLLLVSVLLALAFVPLFWTATTFSRVSLERTERGAATQFGLAVGRAIAAGQLDPELLPQVEGLRFQRKEGSRLELGRPLPAGADEATLQHGFVEEDSQSRVIWSVARGNEGTAYVGVRQVEQRAERASFVGLLALFMGLLGVGLLIAIHFALTILIVRPLDELGHAARRVTTGARPFGLPKLPARELSSLGQSFHIMTERLLAEEQSLRDRIAQVDEANRRLKEAQERLLRSERLASVGRLAAGLAHEVGNPIAAMLGLEELLIQGGLTEAEQQDFLKRIYRETERVHRILRDLLDFARPVAHGSLKVEAPGDVAQAIVETLALVRPQKQFRHVTPEVTLEPGLPWVTLSGPKLVQVCLNLLLNAADALSQKSESEPGRVTLEAHLEGDVVVLSVSDNGPGVPPNIRQTLFEPFVTSKEVGKGTGLGLAVCRGLVEGACGHIQLDEEHAPGAKFVVALPVATPGQA